MKKKWWEYIIGKQEAIALSGLVCVYSLIGFVIYIILNGFSSVSQHIKLLWHYLVG